MKITLNLLLPFAFLACFVYQGQAASKILQIYIKSEGCNDPGISGCGHATIRVNGKDYSKHRRGYNVVVVNGRTGWVESSTSFDTYGLPHAQHGLIYHLKKIGPGKLVLVAIQDEGSYRMSNLAYNALRRFGAHHQIRKSYRSSYALLGWSGHGKLDAVTQVQRRRYQGPSIISKVITLPLF